MKGDIEAGHIPSNRFQLFFLGFVYPITFTEVSEWTKEVETVDLPDGSSASMGISKPVEITVSIMAHHVQDVAQMDAWWAQCQEPVQPMYKRDGTLVSFALPHTKGQHSATIAFVADAIKSRAHLIEGAFIKSRRLSAQSMSDPGNPLRIDYVLRCDNVISELETISQLLF